MAMTMAYFKQMIPDYDNDYYIERAVPKNQESLLSFYRHEISLYY